MQTRQHLPLPESRKFGTGQAVANEGQGGGLSACSAPDNAGYNAGMEYNADRSYDAVGLDDAVGLQ